MTHVTRRTRTKKKSPTKICTKSFFLTLNFLGPKNLSDLIFFQTQHFFCTQNFFGPKSFFDTEIWDPKSFPSKYFLDLKFFSDPKFFQAQKLLFDQKIFWTKKLSDQIWKKTFYFTWILTLKTKPLCYLKLNIRNHNTAHYMNIWYKMHTFHNILLKFAHIFRIFVMKYNKKCNEMLT